MTKITTPHRFFGGSFDISRGLRQSKKLESRQRSVKKKGGGVNFPKEIRRNSGKKLRDKRMRTMIINFMG